MKRVSASHFAAKTTSSCTQQKSGMRRVKRCHHVAQLKGGDKAGDRRTD